MLHIYQDIITPTRSLVELAELKQLPRFQHMDAETLGWIDSNRPKGDRIPLRSDLNSLRIQSVTWPIDPACYLEPRIIDGIHGIRHAMRVAIYAQLLAERHGLSERAQKLLVTAALLHDVRRIDDRADERHGARCAEWISHTENLACLKEFSPFEREIVKSTVAFHDVPMDLDLPDRHDPSAILKDLLRTADALDRYRLPKRSWWMDESRLRMKPTDDLKAFAFDLVVTSERYFLAGEESFFSVMGALRDFQAQYAH